MSHIEKLQADIEAIEIILAQPVRPARAFIVRSTDKIYAYHKENRGGIITLVLHNYPSGFSRSMANALLSNEVRVRSRQYDFEVIPFSEWYADRLNELRVVVRNLLEQAAR